MSEPVPLLSREARLLLLATDDVPSPERILAFLRDPDLDWNRLVALAEREKATAILWSVLQPHRDAIPPLRARQMEMLSSVSDFRMLHHEGQLATVVDLLNACGIQVVLLKGAALATSAYGSFRRRPMYDLDLLVERDEAERAWNTLRRNGWLHAEEECPAAFYTEHYHLPPLDDPKRTGLAVELHTEPWQGGVKLSAAEIWRNAEVVTVGRREYRVPSTTHQILHLATHFAWGHMLRSAAWRSIRDLRALISSGRVDWTEVISAARASGGTTCCFWTFDIARTLADVPIPDDVLEALRPRLPAFVIRILRRHYVGTLFEFSPSPCPSIQLDRLLWTAGHAAGGNDLGPLRPWTRNADWALHAKANAPLGLVARLTNHLNGIRGWRQYLHSVMGPRPNA